jgi:non-specific protein-tyrosine kinase
MAAEVTVMGEQMKKPSRSANSLHVDCGTCRSSFRLNVSLMKDVKGIRILCRKCGAFIDVLNPVEPPEIFLGEAIPGNPSNNLSSNPAKNSEDNPSNNPSNNPISSNPLDRERGKEDDMTISMGETGNPVAADQVKVGWISPDYVASRAVGLNPDWLARNRCVVLDTVSPEAEFYRMLRTKIRHRTEGIRGVTVMVTSALPGEGKTTTAINLAFTFAKSYEQTVLLVDADLKQQKIHEVLGFENDKGLADYLLDTFPLSDSIVWSGIEKLTILSGGRTVTESSELLGSPRMKTLVEEMKSRYPERYVFFDVPPVLVGADAIAFAPLVDCILFVVQAGRTSLQDINRAIKMLPQEKILGLVLNRDPHAVMQDYYK